MTKEYINYTPIWKFENLSHIGSLIHFVTSRVGGYSKGEYESFNLSEMVGDDAYNVTANRKRLAEMLGIIPENLIIPQQTHGNKVGIVVTTSESEDFSETDALITKAKGICLAVLSADCVPIVLYDKKLAIISAIHAGWRGSVANIVGNTISKMTNSYGTNPENIIAGIGPSIAMAHYEVGEEVVTQVKLNFDNYKLFLKPAPDSNKMLLDLKEMNNMLLLKAGVLAEHIETSQLSTFDQPDEFFSARRSGFNCGRFLAGIMINQ